VNPGDEGDRCDSAQPFSAEIDSLPPETRAGSNGIWVRRDSRRLRTLGRDDLQAANVTAQPVAGPQTPLLDLAEQDLLELVTEGQQRRPVDT
jgi:hypothetical protein